VAAAGAPGQGGELIWVMARRPPVRHPETAPL